MEKKIYDNYIIIFVIKSFIFTRRIYNVINVIQQLSLELCFTKVNDLTSAHLFYIDHIKYLNFNYSY